MRFIFIFVFILNSLFAIQNVDKTKLSNIINKIISINGKLQIVKIQDTNKTLKISEYSGIIDKKKQLMSQIPPLITYGKYNSPINEAKDNQLAEKLKIKISINAKAGYLNAIARDELGLEKIKSTKIFYSTLDTLKDLSNTASIKDTLSSTIEESLLALRVIALPTIPKDSIRGDYPIANLENEINELKATINSYIQILTYLHENVGLLKSNYIFSKLDIDHTISFINKIMPFEDKYINTGKVVICIFILLIFWLMVSLLRKRKFLIFIMPFKNTNYKQQTKQAIIKSTNRPFIALLFILSIKLCASVISHPYAYAQSMATIFSILFIVFFSWLIIGVSSGYGIAIVSTMIDKDSTFRKDVINLILKIFYFLVIIIAFLLILGQLGVNVSAIVASLGIGGLAVAWASKDILANFFASVLLLIDNSFSQGDWIVCGDVEGIVVEVGLRRTTIRTFDNALLFVPNSILATDPIRNWNRRKVGRRIKMNIGLTYDSPKEKIEQCVKDIRDMLLNHPSIAKPDDTSLSPKDYRLSFKEHIVSIHDLKGYNRTLFVYLDNFSSSSIDILVYCFSQSTQWEEWLKTKEDVMIKIIDIVEKLGLSFAFLTQSLHIESMPKDELKNKQKEEK